MFGFMMPKGVNELTLSKMNMGGMGSKMIQAVMKQKNVDPLPVMIAQAQKMGVKMVACTMSMDIMVSSLAAAVAALVMAVPMKGDARDWVGSLDPGNWMAWTFPTALFFLVIEGSTLGVLSWMLKPLFDRVFVGGDTNAIWWVGGVIFVLFLIRAATFVINRSLMTSVSLAVSTKMQTDMLRHIMTLDSSFFQSNPPGALIERVQGDSIAVQGVWSTLSRGRGGTWCRCCRCSAWRSMSIRAGRWRR
mgnify:CR=1 FL=1